METEMKRMEEEQLVGRSDMGRNRSQVNSNFNND